MAHSKVVYMHAHANARHVFEYKYMHHNVIMCMQILRNELLLVFIILFFTTLETHNCKPIYDYVAIILA